MASVLLWISWAIIALATVIAVRLTATSLRERSLPEGLMALFFWGGSTFGYGPLLLRPALGLTFEAAEPLRQIAYLGFILPVVSVVLFTWKVFRPEVNWARWLALLLSSLVIVNTVMSLWLAGPMGLAQLFSMEPGTGFYWFSAAVRIAAFGWASAEALIYYRSARKRLRIGLGDRLVVNRFVLWVVWSGGAAAMTALRVVSPFVSDRTVEPMIVPLWMSLLQMSSGFLCVFAIWLTFAAPGFYRRWVLGAPRGQRGGD